MAPLDRPEDEEETLFWEAELESTVGEEVVNRAEEEVIIEVTEDTEEDTEEDIAADPDDEEELWGRY